MFGGIETALVSLARGSREPSQGLDLSVALCFDDGRVARELRDSGAAVYGLGVTRLSRPWQVRQARARLRRLLESEAFDVCVTPSAWTHAIFGPVIHEQGLRLVAWAHDRWTATRWLDRLAMRTRPDLVIANSRYTAEGMQLAFPSIPVRVVHCALAAPPERLRTRTQIRAEFGTTDDTVVILQVGRLDPYKGHGLLIQALGRVTASVPWCCWIVGGADSRAQRKYLATLEGASADAGLRERIVFAGPRQDVNAVLAAVDIFCHPNIEPEPFGLVFVEALRAGLPVVGSASGGVLDIVTDDCGRVVEPGDADGLAEVLSDLIASKELRMRLGARGPARAAVLCDPDARVSDFARALASILPSSSPADVEHPASRSPTVIH